MPLSPVTRCSIVDERERKVYGPQSQLPLLLKQDSFSESPNTDTNKSSKPLDANTHTSCDEVAAVLEAFRLHKVGKLSYQPWQKFSLTRAGYYKLQEALQDETFLDGYVQDKIRYDYFPYYEELVIRMASNFHEFFSRYVNNEINAQLVSLRDGHSPSASFARNIEDWGSPAVPPLDPDYGEHAPDFSFGYINVKLPSVIFEISYSQKRKDLPRLADDYLLGSNGNIQVVIGLDLEYRGSEASISIWKLARTVTSMQVEQIVVNETFRGQTVTSAGLRIPLADFADSIIRAQYQEPIVGEIFISASKLCDFAVTAETRYAHTKSYEYAPLAPGVVKRNREIPPPET